MKSCDSESDHTSEATSSIEVIRRLGDGHGYGRVDLIRTDGRLAVRKTYGPHAKRFFDREYEILRMYGGVCPGIPPLLGADNLFIIMPYYRNDLPQMPLPRHRRLSFPSLLPLKAVREAFITVKFLHARGYAVVDFTPRNILYNSVDGAKVIDYEYTPALQISASLRGGIAR